MTEDRSELVTPLMSDFARRTGLDPEGPRPIRYLWTDAFAVCVYLDLHQRTGEENYLALARRLVEQVHHVLGRHRPDDSRSGWISGLSEEEGEEHPTAGGLRIGKKLPERHRFGPVDPMLEWEQDGQYYHYLTKWMHALERMSASTGEVRYLQQAAELARAVQPRFTHALPTRQKQMYWKMSIDLTYPLVPSMGQHDALDGLVTFTELGEAAKHFTTEVIPDLSAERDDLLTMLTADHWATDDPLGAGALLTDSWRLMQMEAPVSKEVLPSVLRASLLSLDHVAAFMDLQGRAGSRLAFRELGLSIGLHAVEAMRQSKRNGSLDEGSKAMVGELARHISMARLIEGFWSLPSSRSVRSWKEHEDINNVMLAASLSPGEFLTI